MSERSLRNLGTGSLGTSGAGEGSQVAVIFIEYNRDKQIIQ